MVLQERIELSTSPLPRECSTTELLQRRALRQGFCLAWRLIRRNRAGVQEHFRTIYGPFFRARLKMVKCSRTLTNPKPPRKSDRIPPKRGRSG